MKKAIILSILFIGAGISYYFFLFVPSQVEHKFVLECRSLGEQYGKEYLSPLVFQREYYYNPKLKKCFFYWRDINLSREQGRIIDLYTNKEVAGYMVGYPKLSQGEGDEIKKFKDKKRKLFNEK